VLFEFLNRDEWKKAVKLILNNTVVPYDDPAGGFPYPIGIYDKNGTIRFNFNNLTDYWPEELVLNELSEKEAIDLFNVNDIQELISQFELRDEIEIGAWRGIDRNNIEQELEKAITEAMQCQFALVSDDEFENWELESEQLNDLDDYNENY